MYKNTQLSLEIGKIFQVKINKNVQILIKKGRKIRLDAKKLNFVKNYLIVSYLLTITNNTNWTDFFHDHKFTRLYNF